jgi:membrane-associated progesterone receptor component
MLERIFISLLCLFSINRPQYPPYMHLPYIGEVSLVLVVSTGLAAVVLASYFARKESESSSVRKARSLPEGKMEFTAAEVAMFDGKGPEGEPILTIIDGLVYDLQKGREFYGEGGPYHPFAGRDCTRLLAKNQVSDKTDTGAPLSEAELEQLEKWKEFFTNKYGSTGKLTVQQS